MRINAYLVKTELRCRMHTKTNSSSLPENNVTIDRDGECVVRTLLFSSSERSSDTGILSPDEETTALETTFDGRLDPHFFEKGYELEAKTGFKVWPGSRLILQALLSPIGGSEFGRLKYWQERLLNSSKPLNILELGAGIGVVGGSLAAAGADVLMTDLSVLTKYGMSPNLMRNENPSRKPNKPIKSKYMDMLFCFLFNSPMMLLAWKLSNSQDLFHINAM